VKSKRGLFWLQKALNIFGQKTALPTFVREDIQPTVDAFGWDRFTEQQITTVSNPNSVRVVGTTPPENTLRIYLGASLSHGDVGVGHVLWISKSLGQLAGDIEVSLTQGTPIGGHLDITPVALERSCFLLPGNTLRGRSRITMPVAISLVLVEHFVEIPIGEYIPPGF